MRCPSLIAEKLPAYPSGGELNFLVVQEDVNLVETGFDGENIAAHVHVAPHTLVIDVKLQVLGNLRAALGDFLRIVAYAGIAAHVVLKGAGCVVDVAAIVI